MSSFYAINVRLAFNEEGEGVYRLHNFDAPAGDRLRKGENPAKGLLWPFLSRDGDWTRYEDEASALLAAQKLQQYLDKYESKKPKTETKTQPSDHDP